MYLRYRKKWLPSGLRSSHKPRSLLVSAPHQDSHRFARHVWQRTTLMLLFGASVVVTWKESDVSLLACLVRVLLLLDYYASPDPFRAECHPWVCPSANHRGAPVVPPVPLVIRLVCVSKLSATSCAPRLTVCATSAGAAWQWAHQWWCY